MGDWYSCKKLTEITGIGKSLINTHAQKRVFAFYGNMGSGKTTLIKKICEEILLVNENVSSPTFSIVNQYSVPAGDPVYHFDFYRIKKTEEVFDIGFEEYLYSGSYCFIEWPEIIEELLPDNFVYVNIIVLGHEIRSIYF